MDGFFYLGTHLKCAGHFYTSGICSLIATQIKVILFFYSLKINKLVFNYLITKN